MYSAAAAAATAKSLHSCPTLCDPIDGSPPGCPVHGIFQAKYWSGVPLPSPGIFPDQGSNLYLLHWQADSLPLNHRGSLLFSFPKFYLVLSQISLVSLYSFCFSAHTLCLAIFFPQNYEMPIFLLISLMGIL